MANAAETSSWRLVTGDDYPPFTLKAADHGGLFTKIVTESFSAAGDSSNVSWRPWAKGYRDTEGLVFDATFPYIRTPAREAQMLFSRPVFVVRRAVYVNSLYNDVPDSTAHMFGKVYCNPQGYGDDAVIRQMREEGKLTRRRPRDIGKCFDLLSSGQVDFVVASEVLGKAVLSRMGDHAGNIVPVFLADVREFHLHLIVSKQHPHGTEIVRRFNKGLDVLKSSGAFDRIIRQYQF